MFQFLFEQAVASRSLRSRVLERLRRVVVRYHDPVVHYDISGRRISLNLSHQLPLYRNIFPTYSDNLSRLAKFVRRSCGGLRMIDVGANVGDSYCLVEPQPGDEYLLIEGDAHFFKLLERNTGSDRGVTRVQALLSDKPAVAQDALSSIGGTARIVSGSGDARLVYRTLDDVVAENAGFRAVNLLKTDVDGYDCKVLKGGIELIKAAKPVLFFEHHPRMLRSLSEDELEIFSILAGLNYPEFIFYDNRGFLKGTVPVNNAQLLTDFISYALQQEDFYYDICCFNDQQSPLRSQFLAEERRFYAGL